MAVYYAVPQVRRTFFKNSQERINEVAIVSRSHEMTRMKIDNDDDDETEFGIKGDDLNEIFEQHTDNQFLLKRQIDNDKVRIHPGCRQQPKSATYLDSDQLGMETDTDSGEKISKIHFDQNKTTIKILQGSCDDEGDDEIVYSFVPEKRCPVSKRVVKKIQAGPLTLSRRMSSKLAKSTDALESPFCVCRLSFSPNKNSRRRQILVDVKTSTKAVQKLKRRNFASKAKKLPTRC